MEKEYLATRENAKSFAEKVSLPKGRLEESLFDFYELKGGEEKWKEDTPS